MNPHIHNCPVTTLDYGKVKLGLVVCTICGREWRLGVQGWKMEPLTRRKP